MPLSKLLDIIRSYTNVRIISLLLLLPMYAGVDEAWSVFNKVIYPLVLIFVLLAFVYKGKIPRLFTRDNVFALILLYAILVLIFDFRHGTFVTYAVFNASKSWEALVTLLVSFLVIALRVTRREFMAAVILGLGIFYIYRVLGILGMVDVGINELNILSKTAYAFIVFSAGLLLYIRGKRLLSMILLVTVVFQSLRANILAFGITILLYHLHIYIQSNKDSIRQKSNYKLVKSVIIIIVTGILLSEISAAFNIIGNYEFWENITTGRSVFYFRILSQWILNGEGILYPTYPGCAMELASDVIFGKQFASLICAHSILIEMIVDYGVIIGLSFILLMVLFSKKNGIFATCFFLITMAFQCEVFSAFNFVTFLLTYRYLVTEPGHPVAKT